jgi:hypothetical protein
VKYRNHGERWLVFDGDRLVATMPVLSGGDHDHAQTVEAIRQVLGEISEAMKEARKRANSLRYRDINPGEREKQLAALRRELDDVMREDRAQLGAIVEAEIAEANRPQKITGSGVDWAELSARSDGLLRRIERATGSHVGRVFEEEMIDAPEQYRPALARAAGDVVAEKNDPEARRSFATTRARFLTEPEALRIGRRAAAEQWRSGLVWLDQALPREAHRATAATNDGTHNPDRYLGLWARSWEDRSVKAGVKAVERVQAGTITERINAEPAGAGTGADA